MSAKTYKMVKLTKFHAKIKSLAANFQEVKGNIQNIIKFVSTKK